ncbi:MAG TPA: branched-chain amino acid ABC transporter permease [Anaerolineae bacterium]|jgi:branched-chain amino acid transport system permease protein
MAIFFQLLIAGIATGAIYALIAVGFALLWQTSGTINFAQGEFVMVPGFIILGLMAFFKIGLLPAFIITVLITAFFFGYLFKRLLVEPLIEYGDFPLVIATIGLGILLKEGTKLVAGANALSFPEVIPDQILRFAGLRVSTADLAVLAIAVLIIIALQLFLNRSFVGRSMQATAQNANVARILGINVDRMILNTFLINAALVTVGALLITPAYLAKFSNGETLGLLAFMAAIVGGFNQVRGALFGGFLIGVLENLGAFYISSTYRTAFPIILLILVIVFKPEGLFGRSEERRI